MSFCPEIQKIRDAHRGLAEKYANGAVLTSDEQGLLAALAPDPAFKGLVAHFKKEMQSA